MKKMLVKNLIIFSFITCLFLLSACSGSSSSGNSSPLSSEDGQPLSSEEIQALQKVNKLQLNK